MKRNMEIAVTAVTHLVAAVTHLVIESKNKA